MTKSFHKIIKYPEAELEKENQHLLEPRSKRTNIQLYVTRTNWV